LSGSLTSMSTEDRDDLIPSIAPYVMRSLARRRFFEKLDDLFSPQDASRHPQTCDGTYKCSEAILVASGFDSVELGEILDVLKSKGACCDCEILYNVAESSRLKSAYWRKQASKEGSRVHHDPGAYPNTQ
jgi:hypothetical protein